MSGRIAFFDLDLTVLACNSATLWVKRELRLGHVTRTEALRAAWWLGLYQLGLGDLDTAIRVAISSLKGSPEDEIRARTLAFWHEEVAHHVRPGAIDALARHRAAGDRLAFLTGSSTYLSGAALDALSLDDTLCTRFQVRDGLFTGEPDGTICYGAGKLVHAEALAAAHGTTLDQCAFYTDSYSDLPVLEAVGEPVAVHPDPRLLRAAQRRGWRVERWS